MTAVNVFLDPHGVHVMTDGAGTDEKGRLVALQNKPAIYPHLGVVIAVNGPAPIVQIIDTALKASGVTSAGEIIDQLGAIHRAALDRVGANVPAAALASGVVLAAWPPGAKSGAVYASYSFEVDDIGKPFTAARLDGAGLPLVFTSGTSPAIEADLQAKGVDAYSKTARPRREGVALMRAQRKRSLGKHGSSLVGGFCQITSIAPDGRISSEILERYPDRLGERINQEAARWDSGCNSA